MSSYKQVQNLHDQRKDIVETEVDEVAHRKSVIGVTSGEVAHTTSTAHTFGEFAEATVRHESTQRRHTRYDRYDHGRTTFGQGWSAKVVQKSDKKNVDIIRSYTTCAFSD